MERIDPTARGDMVASMVRAWYEANRESWWDRHRPQLFSYRDNSGVVADEFMLRLVAAVYRAETEIGAPLYDEFSRGRIRELEAALSEMIDAQDEWESAVGKILGRPPKVFNRVIDRARVVLHSGSPEAR